MENAQPEQSVSEVLSSALAGSLLGEFLLFPFINNLVSRIWPYWC